MRSHKCTGATLVERQPGDLIQKLMQNSSILPPSSSTSTAVSNECLATTPSTNNLNIPIFSERENEKQHETAATHDLSLDDLLKESYERIMKAQLSPPSQILADNGFENNPATTFQCDNNGMAINASYDDPTIERTTITNNTFNFHSALETINEDSIKELLYGHVG